MITNTPQTLSTAPFAHPTLDYAWLRATGIRQLERLTGGEWTDFNAHDPGITILEQVCYALTDLSYRIDYDLKDLLTGAATEPYRDLFSPATILTSNPVTLTDLRKVVLDVAGVRNAWITPQETVTPPLYYDPADQSLYLQAGPQRQPLALRGVYQVLVATDGTVDEVTLRNAVAQRLHACRNLGELFEPPRILPQQRITVRAELEVAALDDPDQVLATVYQVLDNFLAPRIRFHTLAELLAQGHAIDEIMEGPWLEHGFIVTAELEALTGPRSGLRASDLIQAMMNVVGVRAVNTITLSDGVTSDAWYLALDATRTPMLELADPPTIQLVRNGLTVRTDSARVRQRLASLQQADRSAPQPSAMRDLHLPPGRNRHIERYYPIQQQLPALYGLGAAGLPASASAERQAQVKQLQAYLLFFDQLLANAFAQVAHVKALFAFDAPVDETAAQSYFTQPLDDPALGLAEIWVTADATARTAQLQALAEEEATAAARKNRFLNHLLARFSEAFTTFDFAHPTPINALVGKAAFLQAYPELSAARGRACDLTNAADATGRLPRGSLEKRISHKLGLTGEPSVALATLAASDPGGFYLIEHILLRPEMTDPAATALAPSEVGWQAGALLALPGQLARRDPYSQQLTFVLPDWIDRFNASGFRAFIEQTLRAETPAHLAVHLLWLPQEQMSRFDAVYQAWRATLLPTTTDPARVAARAARDGLIDWLGLGAPYPLRDLALTYPAMVAVGQPAAIQLQPAQAGVTYRLCDEEGNPLDEVMPLTVDGKTPPTTATLTTPKIAADHTFTILATRTHTARGEALSAPLETYLKQSVSLKAGINSELAVEFLVGGHPLNPDNPAPIDYRTAITAQVKGSQAGILYELVDGQNKAARSPAEKGDQNAPITLTSTLLTEDSEIKIRAYRPSGSGSADPAPSSETLLRRTIKVKVRPNPAVKVAVAAPIVTYQGTATLTLVDAQASVTYQLYQRLLKSSEYATTDQAPRTLPIAGDEGRMIYIKAPPPISDWDQPASFAPGATFAVVNNALTATLTDLREDSYVIVRATKTANQSSLALDQVVVILVRPDPAPQVEAEQTPISAGSIGVVTVNGTQQGVAYQLLAAGNPVNEPGYDVRDHAIETMRVEVDFVVEPPADANADQTLRLPTELLAEETTFTVQATKVYTGLRTRLKKRVTIAVTPSPGSTAGTGTEQPRGLTPAPTETPARSADTSSLPAATNVTATDAGPDVSPEQAVVDFNQRTRIRIKASRAQEWYQLWLADQPLADPVKGTGRDRLLATPPLQTDTRLALHITRPADPTAAERVIDLLVRVRPNPTLAVSADAARVAANAATTITVAASQVGVQYQLWADDQPIGAPVAGNGAVIVLPTRPLTVTTTFTIRATRLDEPTFVVDLTQRVTVQVG